MLEEERPGDLEAVAVVILQVACLAHECLVLVAVILQPVLLVLLTLFDNESFLSLCICLCQLQYLEVDLHACYIGVHYFLVTAQRTLENASSLVVERCLCDHGSDAFLAEGMSANEQQGFSSAALEVLSTNGAKEGLLL